MEENKKSQKLVIGLTGSWASGCSTVAEVLRSIFNEKVEVDEQGQVNQKKQAKVFKLSDVVERKRIELLKESDSIIQELGFSIFYKILRREGEKKRASEFSDEERKHIKESKCDAVIEELKNIDTLSIIDKRILYQDIGNALREEKGGDFLVRELKPKIDENINMGFNVIIDGIKNIEEHTYLENYYYDYFLFNINAPYKVRQDRKPQVNAEDFSKNDERDSEETWEYGEQVTYGQQVKRCVDYSDVILTNKVDGISGRSSLKSRLRDVVGLITKEQPRPPTDNELFMTSAYSISLRSSCSKRKIGAVIVKDEHIIASGFNDVPSGRKEGVEKVTDSCVEFLKDFSDERCFRDYVKKLFDKPKFKGEQDLYPYKERKEHENLFHKHLDLCRALHAEERAILQASRLGGVSIKGSSIYTTTFPCQLCAKKIIQVGIWKVVYCEPYPDKLSKEMLENAGVEIVEFEGVKAKAYFRLFV